MSSNMIRRVLFALPPEIAHNTALAALRLAGAFRLPLARGPFHSEFVVECMGLKFPNAVGLAAGFDKNGDCVEALGNLGFGFIEIGTITPRPQCGNPKPRIFRLPESQALINQMGSPNKGIDHAVEKIKRHRYRGILGANIGKNSDTPLKQAVDDYVCGYQAVSPHADYVAINVSSPNTQGLRELQAKQYLKQILDALVQKRCSATNPTPILVKLSPDLSARELDSIADVIVETGIDGVIATNTTTSRKGVSFEHPKMKLGGLSGKPLHEKSLAMISMLRERLGEQIGIIGVGGIMTSDDALQTLAAGANLVQIYAGFVYQGPSLVSDLVEAVG